MMFAGVFVQGVASVRLFRLAEGAAVAAVCGLLVLGCSRAEQKAQQQQSVKALALLHGRYLSQHRGQPPANEADFKKFVQALSPTELTAFGATDADSLFVSPRDKKPLGVVYGTPSGPPGPAGAPVVVYEQEGKGGKRLVASSLGAVEEVDEARFRQLVPAAKSP